MSRIAFIGLGNMGGPMAANLVKAGHSLRVFDLVPAALQAAQAAGALPATTLYRCTDATGALTVQMVHAEHAL